MVWKIGSFLRQVAAGFAVRRYGRRLKKTEAATGVVPRITHFSGFYPGHESSIMSGYWQAGGVPIQGVNYWTMGIPTDCVSSSRFDPDSRMYQAWLGAYTLVPLDEKCQRPPGIKNGSPDMKFFGRIAAIDQNVWLKLYGVEFPYASLEKWELKEKTNIGGNDAWVYYGEMISLSDVGEEGAYGYAHLAARRLRFVPDSEIGISPEEKFFVPDAALWKDKVDPHHRLLLKGLFAVVPYGRGVACAYMNGAEFEDKSGKSHDTWPLLKDDAEAALRSVKLEAV